MKGKRFMTGLAVLLLLCALTQAVSAELPESMQTLQKQYSLKLSETYGSIDTTPTTPAFWEYPILRAGEQYAEGTLVVRNDSDYTATMELTEVVLPYGDEQKLTYLDHLELTVSEGETVLYDNTYAHVNDEEGGLSIKLEAMSPGEEHVYTVKLRCRYDYAGDPYADASQVAWMFGASTQTTSYEQPEGLPQWALITVVTFAVLIVALVIVMIVRAGMMKKRVDKSE